MSTGSLVPVNPNCLGASGSFDVISIVAVKVPVCPGWKAISMVQLSPAGIAGDVVRHGSVPLIVSNWKLIVSDRDILETSKRCEPLFVIKMSKGAAALPTVTVPKSKFVSGEIWIEGVPPFPTALTVPVSEQPEIAIEKNANKIPCAIFWRFFMRTSLIATLLRKGIVK